MSLNIENNDNAARSSMSFELHEAIKQALKPTHPLDQEYDFDPIEYLNQRFPDANSLEGIHEYARGLRNEVDILDSEILQGIRANAQASQASSADLASTFDAINELTVRIASIRDRAEESQTTVTSVSRDIVALDTAKKNVSLTINTLKKLVMMVNACEQLAELGGSREYAQTPALVLSIKDLAVSFEDIKHIPRIEELLKHKDRVLTDLKLQIIEDFDLRIFISNPTHGSKGSRIISSVEDIERIDFAGAAQAVDALGVEVRMEIINKYCLVVMEEYQTQFSPPNGVHADLQFFEKRFVWLTKALKEFTDKHAQLFSQNWIVNGELCMHFCHETRQHFVMTNMAQSPDLMISVLIKCLELENDMQRRFDKLTRKLFQGGDDQTKIQLQFKGVVTGCFDPYLTSWVNHEEKALAATIAAAGNIAADELIGTLAHSTEGREMSIDNSDADPPLIFASAVNLFATFRTLLERCAQFDKGKIMATLFAVFQTIIQSYVDRVLVERLPKKKKNTLTNEETLTRICALIGSCDYCLKMAPHLHKNCLSLLSKALDVSIHMEIEKLAETREVCQEALVEAVTNGGEMRNAVSGISHMDWWNCESAAGVSSHVNNFRSCLETALLILGKKLSESHFKAMIEMIAQKLISQINESIYAAKPIGEMGAQQLLIDVGEIRNVLLETPVKLFHKNVATTYTFLVNEGFHRVECSLKALSSPASNDPYSLRAMLDSLDPALAKAGSGVLDKEVERLMALRKPSSNSATVNRRTSMTSLLSTQIEFSPTVRGDQSPHGGTAVNSSTVTAQSKTTKSDLKADFTKFGQSLMKNKLFGGSGSTHK